MMTVPNRSLRLLTPEELSEFGLTGRNAAQEDLDRIRLVRRCGLDFARRLDGFYRTYEQKCATLETGVDAINDCGRALRPEFGFPDAKCPTDSPLAALDAKPVETPADDDAGGKAAARRRQG